MKIDIATQLSGHVFPFMMIFCRLGAGLMMFPGFGESFVTVRIRMMFALVISFLFVPLLAPVMPAIPEQPGDLVRVIFIELMVGVFFGFVMRLLMGMLETAGAIVSMDIGLSNASILSPSLASQSALISAFLSTAALALVFISDFHHLLLRALMNTYTIFPVGEALPFGDLVQSYVGLVSRAFLVGIQLASPLIIMGLLLYTAMGVMQRLMSQIQLFLVLIPLQIWGGLFVFSACIGIIFAVWMRVFDDVVGVYFFQRGGG